MGELHRIILCEHKSCRFEHSENLCFLRKPVFSPPTEKKQVAEAVGIYNSKNLHTKRARRNDWTFDYGWVGVHHHLWHDVP